MSYRDWKAVYVDKSKTLETWRANLTAPAAGGKVTIDKGALNENNDPGGKKRNAHAEMFYAARRNSKKEPWVKRIAQNSGMSEKAISKIFDHVFIKEHDLWDGRHTFLPDYYMAESFRRLHEGKNIQPHDMILLRHEWLELSLMNRYDYDYDTAHNITERKYNYKFALIEWHKRMGIPWNG